METEFPRVLRRRQRTVGHHGSARARPPVQCVRPATRPNTCFVLSGVRVVVTGRRLFGQVSCLVTGTQQSRCGNTYSLWAEKEVTVSS